MSAKLKLNLDKPNINLDDAKAMNKTQIFHSITYKGVRFRLFTGELVVPKYWDKKKQRVHSNAPQAANINAILKMQQNEIYDITTRLIIQKNKVNKETVQPLLSFSSKVQASTFSVIKAFDQFISFNKKSCAIATIKSYTSTKKHLEKLSAIKRLNLEFDIFDKNFLTIFEEYFFEDLKVFQNTYSKNTTVLKTFLKWAFEKGYHSSTHYQLYKVKEESNKSVVFLTLDEIARIEELQLTDHLDKIRDIFLIECYCGLRFGDICKLKSEHFKDGGIEIRAQKTNTILRIPFNNNLRRIFDKYTVGTEIKVPVISNQKTNDSIKQICRLAKIKTPTVYTQFRGSRKTETIYEKWELVSTHTGRHSFITNSIEKGMDAETIKKIVGHKKHETFAKYSQYNSEHTKAQMSKWDKLVPLHENK